MPAWGIRGWRVGFASKKNLGNHSFRRQVRFALASTLLAILSMRSTIEYKYDWIYENSANKLPQITREWVSEYFIYSRILE